MQTPQRKKPGVEDRGQENRFTSVVLWTLCSEMEVQLSPMFVWMVKLQRLLWNRLCRCHSKPAERAKVSLSNNIAGQVSAERMKDLPDWKGTKVTTGFWTLANKDGIWGPESCFCSLKEFFLGENWTVFISWPYCQQILSCYSHVCSVSDKTEKWSKLMTPRGSGPHPVSLCQSLLILHRNILIRVNKMAL